MITALHRSEPNIVSIIFKISKKRSPVIPDQDLRGCLGRYLPNGPSYDRPWPHANMIQYETS